jgi:heat shock protein HtpX
MNTLKTTLLLGMLTGLLLVIGQLLGGRSGMMVALVFAAILNFGSYWFSDKIVLRMYRAQPVSETQYPALHRVVDRLVQRAGLPKPALYVLPMAAPNAFATGRNPRHAAVAVTSGLLDQMTEEELEGVVAHELGHVKNRDILISSIAATVAGAIMMLASMARWGAMFGGFGDRNGRDGGGIIGLLAVAIFAPLAALVVQMAISRTREFKADATGAAIAGYPQGLASALRKLEALSKRVPTQASPNTAHMFIVKPFSGAGLGRLFSTHPSTEERVRRLMAL